MKFRKTAVFMIAICAVTLIIGLGAVSSLFTDSGNTEAKAKIGTIKEPVTEYAYLIPNSDLLEDTSLGKIQYKTKSVANGKFLRSLSAPTSGTITADVSKNQDGSILIWISDNNMYWYSEAKQIKVTNARRMFSAYSINNDYCKFSEIDLKDMDFSECTDFSEMFNTQSVLTNIDNCSNLAKADNVNNLYKMFYGCNALKEIDLSGLQTENANMSYVFYGCKAAEKINLADVKTTGCTNMSNLFSGCNALSNIDVSSFDTDSVADMSSMFSMCYELQNLDISNFNFENVEKTTGMFSTCKKLEKIYAFMSIPTDKSPTWYEDGTQTHMFDGDTVLAGCSGTAYSSSYDNYNFARIDNPHAQKGYFTPSSKFDTWTINYSANGGSGSMASKKFQYLTSDALTANTFKAPSDDTVFNCWNTEPDGSGKSFSDMSNVSLVDFLQLPYHYWKNWSFSENNPSITLYAQWINPKKTKFSHTSNIDNAGMANSSSSGTKTDTITIANASKLHIKVYADNDITLYYSSNLEQSKRIADTNYFYDRKYNINIVLKDKPTKEQCVACWEGVIDGNSVKFNYTTPSNSSSNYGYYAVVTGVFPSGFTVKFDANGGAGSMDSELYSENDSKPLNENTFESSTNAFLGWNTEQDGSGKSIDDKQNISYTDIYEYLSEDSVLTLYAQWGRSKIKYSHTANIDDTGAAESDYGPNLNVKDVVTIPGAEWLNVKLYASFESGQNTYMCVWAGAHSDYSVGNNYSTSKLGTYSGKMDFRTGSKNRVYKAAANFVEGNINGNSVTFATTTPAGGTGNAYGYYAVIKGIFPINFTVNFDANGGSGNMESEYYSKNDSKVLEENIFNAPDSTAIFAGWNTSSDGTGKSFSDGQNISFGDVYDYCDESASVTLYAQWQSTTSEESNAKIIHSININDDGTAFRPTSSSDPSQTKVVSIPGAIRLNIKLYSATNYSSLDYLCIWSGSHPEYFAGHDYSESLLYKSDGSVYSGNLADGKKKQTKAEAMVREGYVDGDTVTFGFYTHGGYYGYYAVITGVFPSGFTVKFDAHGGTGSMESESYSSSITKALPENTFENHASEHMVFLGWNTSADGTGKSFDDKQIISFADVNGYCDNDSIVTLYAQWLDLTTAKKYSHTSNIDNDGTASGKYANNLNTTDVVTIQDASNLHVKLYYSTETFSDYICVWAGSHPDYTAAVNYGSSSLGGKTGKFGGGKATVMSNATVIEGDIEGDAVTFGFKSDSRQGYYGYYAVVTDASDTASAKSLTIFGSWDE